MVWHPRWRQWIETAVPVAVLGAGVLIGILVSIPSFTPLRNVNAIASPHRLSVPAARLERTVRWYERKLGFERVGLPDDGDAGRHVLLARAGTLIDLQQDSPASRPAAIPVEVEDLDAETDALRLKGVHVLDDGPSAVRRVSRIQDPNGYALELREPE